MSEMIYERLDADAPIRQGDIFRNIPKIIDFSTDAMSVVDKDDQISIRSWEDLIAEEGFPGSVETIVAVEPVDAIVITQDCDLVRSPEITLCQIDTFQIVMKITPPTVAAKWMNLITKQCRMNQKWYYLPIAEEFGFTEKMAVDFQSVIRVGREDIEKMKSGHRIGRLNDLAIAHFRERVGEFFRRYPYDEWYPLTKEELEAYRKNKGDSEPFPWQ